MLPAEQGTHKSLVEFIKHVKLTLRSTRFTTQHFQIPASPIEQIGLWFPRTM